MKVIITPQRYGTDLGRLADDCSASTHGTYTAYRRGCRCPHAREAHRVYQKRLREGRQEDRLIDACGVRRRIQALWAIGHTCEDIAAAANGRCSAAQVFGLTKRRFVTRPTWDVVVAAYWVLAPVPGRSARSRARGETAGWPSPMRWGTDIDVPTAIPEPILPGLAADEVVDEVAVERALSGERVDLTDAELIVVLQAGIARGEPLSKLAERLGLNHWGARKMLGGELTPRREKRARVEAEILRSSANDYVIAANLGVNRSTVSRARKRLIASGALVAA